MAAASCDARNRHELARRRVLRRFQRRQHVDDGRRLLAGDAIRDADALRDGGVGGVDDPRLRVPGVDRGERRADVHRGDHLVLDPVPEAERLEPRARVDSRRNRVRVRQHQVLELRQVGRSGDRGLRVGGDDDDQIVREHVATIGLVDEARLLELVHPRRVGREEDVGGRARLDLAREIAGGTEAEADRVAAALLERLPELGHRVGQARRGERQQLGGPSRRAPAEQEHEEERCRTTSTRGSHGGTRLSKRTEQVKAGSARVPSLRERSSGIVRRHGAGQGHRRHDAGRRTARAGARARRSRHRAREASLTCLAWSDGPRS